MVLEKKRDRNREERERYSKFPEFFTKVQGFSVPKQCSSLTDDGIWKEKYDVE